jgi:flagellar biosynthesis protein FliP
VHLNFASTSGSAGSSLRAYALRLRSFRRASREAHPRAHLVLVCLALALWTFAMVSSRPSNAQSIEPDTPQVTVPALPNPVPAIDTPSIEQPTTAEPGSGQLDANADEDGESSSLQLDVGDLENTPNNSVIILIGLTLLSLAPSLLIMFTSFARIVIVLGLTRQALGLQSIPPNQVITGLALFLSLFVMGPTLSQMNEVGLQPLLRGDKSQNEAFEDALVPLKGFMLDNTRNAELNMLVDIADVERPEQGEDTPIQVLIPAFLLSELKSAFIIGFVIFVPFLVIDLVVSAILMALGMMMLPPAFVALPFKLLLFVMVDGWALTVQTLLRSFQ